MKIALASDHAGFILKKEIAEHLRQKGIPVLDCGCDSEERVDYVEFGVKGVRSVLAGDCDRAILVCGSGLGMAILANKFRGIRATPCWDEYSAEMSRKHNDSNCLTLGGRILTTEPAKRIVDLWLRTGFEGGRHEQRNAQISRLEEQNFKP